MENFTILKKLGEGTYGVVWQAMDQYSGEFVAIKMLKTKYSSWKDCLKLKEVKSLRGLDHPNIVKLKQVFMEGSKFFLVFEYLERNLLQVMENRGEIRFPESQIRVWCFQLFQALAYMHRHGYFHRDLKPENILIKSGKIKIADFGMVREIGSEPPYTDYVMSRWYRAPEVILKAPIYGSAVDMWAMGAIMAEMFLFSPLFPGRTEADEVYRICSVIGSPNANSWVEGLQLANKLNYQFPKIDSIPLSLVIPSASENARNLIELLCSWDPKKRPSAVDALQHPFFTSFYVVPPPIPLPPPTRSIRSFAAIECPSGPKRTTSEECNRAQRNSGILCDSVIASLISSVKAVALQE